MTPLFSISSQAIQKILSLSPKEGRPIFLRVRVESGGCAGFQYHFLLEEEKAAEDIVFEEEGAIVLVDPISLELLKGATLDFVESMMEASFALKNPNSTSSCGCGTSFSVF